MATTPLRLHKPIGQNQRQYKKSFQLKIINPTDIMTKKSIKKLMIIPSYVRENENDSARCAPQEGCVFVLIHISFNQ